MQQVYELLKLWYRKEYIMKNVPKTPEKNTLGTRISYGVVLFIIVTVVSIIIWQTIQFYRTTHTLKSLSPLAIRELKIYPRVGSARGKPVIFSSPDTLIDQFLNALIDIRTYRGGSKGVMSFDHMWFIELETTEGRVIQMPCHLPANGKKVVHGTVGRFYEWGVVPYGDFQSQKMFQWYQQYSHRWLGEKGEDEGISLESSH
jgi:hypothetical protein